MKTEYGTVPHFIILSSSSDLCYQMFASFDLGWVEWQVGLNGKFLEGMPSLVNLF